ALLAAMKANGETVCAYKPAVTGLDEPSETGWPADHELLGAAAGIAAEQVSPLHFGPAVSPLLAAELAGAPLTAETLVTRSAGVVREAQQAEATLIVEGVGGLLSPLAENFTVCDLAVSLRLPLLLAARPGLGTINHTLLTLQAARAAGLDVRAVVLTPWPEQPSRLEQSNLETIRRFGFVELDTLAQASSPEVDELARIGAALPWRRWLDETVSAPAQVQ
ncbi:MAG TPA: dethiobiotin synthase, partial [Solirubrobacteraceae bacterium]|nr:dethiobiotin synthase [Solirubrobacteraceae bacterium]